MTDQCCATCRYPPAVSSIVGSKNLAGQPVVHQVQAFPNMNGRQGWCGEFAPTTEGMN